MKATNGMRHSAYFTLGNFHEPIRITESNRRVAEHSCVYCHERLVRSIQGHDGSLRCVSCHPRVGHQD